MEKKQSSIDWLEEQIKDIFYVAEASEMTKKFKSVYEQAKAMHKEEVESAWINGTRGQMIAPFGMNRYKPDAEEYYNETFGGEDE